MTCACGQTAYGMRGGPCLEHVQRRRGSLAETFSTAMAVMRLLAIRDRTVAELAEKLGVGKGTVERTLVVLDEAGMRVTRTPDPRHKQRLYVRLDAVTVDATGRMAIDAWGRHVTGGTKGTAARGGGGGVVAGAVLAGRGTAAVDDTHGAAGRAPSDVTHSQGGLQGVPRAAQRGAGGASGQAWGSRPGAAAQASNENERNQLKSVKPPQTVGRLAPEHLDSEHAA